MVLEKINSREMGSPTNAKCNLINFFFENVENFEIQKKKSLVVVQPPKIEQTKAIVLEKVNSRETIENNRGLQLPFKKIQI